MPPSGDTKKKQQQRSAKAKISPDAKAYIERRIQEKYPHIYGPKFVDAWFLPHYVAGYQPGIDPLTALDRLLADEERCTRLANKAYCDERKFLLRQRVVSSPISRDRDRTRDGKRPRSADVSAKDGGDRRAARPDRARPSGEGQGAQERALIEESVDACSERVLTIFKEIIKTEIEGALEQFFGALEWDELLGRVRRLTDPETEEEEGDEEEEDVKPAPQEKKRRVEEPTVEPDTPGSRSK